MAKMSKMLVNGLRVSLKHNPFYRFLSFFPPFSLYFIVTYIEFHMAAQLHMDYFSNEVEQPFGSRKLKDVIIIILRYYTNIFFVL